MTRSALLCVAIAGPGLLLALATRGAGAEPGSVTGTTDLQRFCQRLIAHQPDRGVSYVPGLDVRGQPVAPGDLPPDGGPRPSGQISLPLTHDLARQLGPVGRTLPGSLQLGTLTVVGGQAYLDDRPLEGSDDTQLRELCRTGGR